MKLWESADTMATTLPKSEVKEQKKNVFLVIILLSFFLTFSNKQNKAGVGHGRLRRGWQNWACAPLKKFCAEAFFLPMGKVKGFFSMWTALFSTWGHFFPCGGPFSPYFFWVFNPHPWQGGGGLSFFCHCFRSFIIMVVDSN